MICPLLSALNARELTPCIGSRCALWCVTSFPVVTVIDGVDQPPTEPGYGRCGLMQSFYTAGEPDPAFGTP